MATHLMAREGEEMDFQCASVCLETILSHLEITLNP